MDSCRDGKFPLGRAIRETARERVEVNRVKFCDRVTVDRPYLVGVMEF